MEITDGEVKAWVTGKDLSNRVSPMKSAALPELQSPVPQNDHYQFFLTNLSCMGFILRTLCQAVYRLMFRVFPRDHPALPAWTMLCKIAPDLGSDLSSRENLTCFSLPPTNHTASDTHQGHAIQPRYFSGGENEVRFEMPLKSNPGPISQPERIP